jgi:hypothetical protein
LRSRGKREQMRNNERHERLASPKRREAERREAHQPEPHRQAMRRAPSLLSSHCGRTEAQDFIKPWTSKNGAGALAFRRPTAASEVFALGSAWAALPGTTGCKREDPLRHQCSEHLAVRHVPDGTMPKPPASAVYGCAHENRPRSALRSTLAKGVPLRARCWFGNCIGDRCQEQCHFIRDAPLGALAQRNPPFSVLSARRSRDHEP